MSRKSPIVGINLGTSNCVACVACYDSNKPHVINSYSRSLPSTLFYNTGDSITIGKKSEEMGAGVSTGLIFNWREYFCLSYDSNKVIDALHSGNDIVLKDKTLYYSVPRIGSDFKKTVSDVAKDYLTKLLQMEKSLCQVYFDISTPISVALSVPSSFTMSQRREWEVVGKSCGVSDVLFVEEPIAAVLSHSSLTDSSSKLFLICDIGSTMFRLSLVQKAGSTFFILGKGNQDYLGANKIDGLLLSFIREQVERSKCTETIDWFRSLKKDCGKWNHLLRQIVKMKESLSQVNSYDFDFEKIHVTVTRSDLETLTKGCFLDMLNTADHLLQLYHVKKETLSSVLLMGGSFSLPRATRTFQEHFQHVDCILLEHDAIAKGALITRWYSASIRMSKRPLRGAKEIKPSGEEDLFPDNVFTEPISVRREDGRCMELLHRNQPLDSEATFFIHPVDEKQSVMQLYFCQGQSERFSDNTPIGTIVFDACKDYKHGDPDYEVTVSVDKRGILSCTIMDPKSGITITETLSFSRRYSESPIESEELMKEYKSLYREVVNLRRTKKGAIYSIMTNRIHIVSQKYTEGAPLEELIQLFQNLLKEYDRDETKGEKLSFDDYIYRDGNLEKSKCLVTYNIKSKQVSGIIDNEICVTLVKRELGKKFVVFFNIANGTMQEYEQEWSNDDNSSSNEMKELPPCKMGRLNWDMNGGRWEGGVKDGKAFGFGVLYNEEGRKKYEGFLWNEKKNGWGCLYRDDVELVEYRGCFYDDKKWGYGVELSEAGDVSYSGYWMNDKKYPKEIKERALEISTQQKEVSLCCSPDVYSFELDKWIRNLEKLVIKDMSFQEVALFSLDGLPELKTVEIGNVCFSESRDYSAKEKCDSQLDNRKKDSSYRIINCPSLSSIVIGDYSFYDYSSFELIDLPMLESITIGKSAFKNCQSILLESMRTILVHLQICRNYSQLDLINGLLLVMTVMIEKQLALNPTTTRTH